MSSAGHVLDMIKRIRQNRALRPSNRQRFKENNRENIYTDNVDPVDRLNFKIVTEEKLSGLKKQIRQRAERERKEELVLYVVFLAIGSMIGLGIILSI